MLKTAWPLAGPALVARTAAPVPKPEHASGRPDPVESAKEAERLILNQYKAGTLAYTSVVTAQAAALSSEQTAVRENRLIASVALIEALGGGWNAARAFNRREHSKPLELTLVKGRCSDLLLGGITLVWSRRHSTGSRQRPHWATLRGREHPAAVRSP
jgi:hypothetical protein